jgi:putative membrane protein
MRRDDAPDDGFSDALIFVAKLVADRPDHLAAFSLFAALVVELVSIREPLTVATARRLLAADLVYGIAAGVVLVVGFSRVFHFEKGATFAKLTLFVIVGLVSIIPTREFLPWRTIVKSARAPDVSAARLRRLGTLIHLELAGIVVILLMAALMAKGVGLLL